MAGRVVPHENTKQRDIVKVSINERVPNNQSLSSSSSPQSMASVLQLPNMSSTSKSAKEVKTAWTSLLLQQRRIAFEKHF